MKTKEGIESNLNKKIPIKLLMLVIVVLTLLGLLISNICYTKLSIAKEKTKIVAEIKYMLSGTVTISEFGFDTYTSPNNDKMEYYEMKPGNLDEDSYLVVYLHGSGISTRHFEDQATDIPIVKAVEGERISSLIKEDDTSMIKELYEDGKIAILVPNWTNGATADTVKPKPTLDSYSDLDEFIQTYAEDLGVWPDHIVLMGHSLGVYAVNGIVKNNDEYEIAAVASLNKSLDDNFEDMYLMGACGTSDTATNHNGMEDKVEEVGGDWKSLKGGSHGFGDLWLATNDLWEWMKDKMNQVDHGITKGESQETEVDMSKEDKSFEDILKESIGKTIKNIFKDLLKDLAESAKNLFKNLLELQSDDDFTSSGREAALEAANNQDTSRKQ